MGFFSLDNVFLSGNVHPLWEEDSDPGERPRLALVNSPGCAPAVPPGAIESYVALGTQGALRNPPEGAGEALA